MEKLVARIELQRLKGVNTIQVGVDNLAGLLQEAGGCSMTARIRTTKQARHIRAGIQLANAVRSPTNPLPDGGKLTWLTWRAYYRRMEQLIERDKQAERAAKWVRAAQIRRRVVQQREQRNNLAA